MSPISLIPSLCFSLHNETRIGKYFSYTHEGRAKHGTSPFNVFTVWAANLKDKGRCHHETFVNLHVRHYSARIWVIC